jgi:hypothetical protein
VDPTSYTGGGVYANHSSGVINANVILANRALAGAGIAAGDPSTGSGPSALRASARRLALNTVKGQALGYTLTNNLVAQNTGGGILFHVGQIVNNTVRDNQANDYGEYGDGILIAPLAAPAVVTLTNNIVVSNVYGIGRLDTGVTVNLLHNDVWGNSAADYAGLSPGASDIAADPRLASLAEGGHRLLTGSPCLDAGTETGAPPTDIEGDPRPADGDGDGFAVSDIGADEAAPAAPPEGTPTATPTETATPEGTPSATPTETATPEGTPSATPTETATPEDTPTPSATPSPTETATATGTATATSSPTRQPPTATRTPTGTPTRTPTRRNTPTPTASRTPTPTASRTPTPTASRTLTPTASRTLTPTAVPHRLYFPLLLRVARPR